MKIVEFKPTYTREDGLVVVYGKSIPFPKGFVVNKEESGVVVFPPGSKGGNHKHPRIEVFYSTGDLTNVWIDKKGKKHQESMSPRNGKYKLFITTQNEPHAVINNTKTPQVLVEYASEPQHDLGQVDIV